MLFIVFEKVERGWFIPSGLLKGLIGFITKLNLKSKLISNFSSVNKFTVNFLFKQLHHVFITQT